MEREQFVKRKQEIICKMEHLQEEIDKLPEGKFYCRKNGTYSKWYLKNDSIVTYLPKEQKPLAEKMAYKAYLENKLYGLRKELSAIDAYEERYDFEKIQNSNQIFMSSQYQELLTPYFVLNNQNDIEWTNTPYDKNEKYPEALVHKTLSGEMVRSKSEVLIDTVLYENKIPFRYECGLKLGRTTLYPDFTILHPRTRNVYYWEHFGLMDDLDYSKKAFLKLQTYSAHGIIPSVQLITTYETKEYPLTIEKIEEIVKSYFL